MRDLLHHINGTTALPRPTDLFVLSWIYSFINPILLDDTMELGQNAMTSRIGERKCSNTTRSCVLLISIINFIPFSRVTSPQ
jgi:hypothetical protein